MCHVCVVFFLFFQGFQARQEVKVLVVAVLPHPPRPNIVIYSLGESTPLWTHILKGCGCTTIYFARMDSCVFGCCAGIKCCSQKCFSFLYSLMEELYAIDQS